MFDEVLKLDFIVFTKYLHFYPWFTNSSSNAIEVGKQSTWGFGEPYIYIWFWGEIWRKFLFTYNSTIFIKTLTFTHSTMVNQTNLNPM